MEKKKESVNKENKDNKENIELEASDLENINIFDELSSDDYKSKKKEVLSKEEKILRWISIVSSSCQTIWVLLFIAAACLFWYIKLQSQEEFKANTFLFPFCPILIWDIVLDDWKCTTVSSLNKEYSDKKTKLLKEQTEKIIAMLEPLYVENSFTKSKSVVFLSDKSKSKIEVLSMIEKFDDLKTNFWFEKSKIQCEEINIDSDNIFSASCTAYSVWYEDGIRWFDWTNDTRVSWTSISIATSFLNYIEKNSDDFSVINKQKAFNSEDTSIEWTWYTQKTDFDIFLKYNPTTLSL